MQPCPARHTQIQHFGQTAEATPAPQIDLEQAIPCSSHTLDKESIIDTLRVDVWNAPLIDENLRGSLKTADLYCVGHRLGSVSRPRVWIG